MHANLTLRIANLALLLLAGVAHGQNPTPEQLAVGCLGCHGSNVQGQGLIPELKGLSVTEFKATYSAFSSGKRAGTVMPRIVKGYSKTEWDQIAEYFSKSPDGR